MNYFDELKRTMEWLAQQPKIIFLGQATAVPGTFMYQTLRDVPTERRLEMPVAEQFQMQFSIGLALSGKIPISIYPRQNFLLLATADMVNMLDKIPSISNNKINPHMIIRVASGPNKPIHPGHQHVGNYVDAFRRMFTSISVLEVNEPEEIFPQYEFAYNIPGAYLIVENGNNYNDK